jgi:RND family efflux transporter MFP subunit
VIPSRCGLVPPPSRPRPAGRATRPPSSRPGYVRAIRSSRGADGGSRILQEGDFVATGTVLAQLEAADHHQRLLVTRAGLAQASATREKAQLDLGRTRALIASNSIPRSELDSSSLDMDAAEARVAGARANVRAAELALDDCELRSSISGVVLKRSVEIGTLANPDTVAFTIADTSSVKVTFGAPDVVVNSLETGTAVEVTLDALPGVRRAQVTRIAPAADSCSRRSPLG